MNIFDALSLISSYAATCWCFVYVIIFCVDAGIASFMSISAELNPYFFNQQMDKTWSMKEEWDGELFFPATVGIFYI